MLWGMQLWYDHVETSCCTDAKCDPAQSPAPTAMQAPHIANAPPNTATRSTPTPLAHPETAQLWPISQSQPHQPP